MLAAALLVGELFERFRFPSVIGEILAGMIIGPSLLGLVAPSDSIQAVTSIALFFIIFHIGFEMKTQMVNGKLRAASLLALTSFLVPLVLMVFAAMIFFPFSTQQSLIVALAIAVPSLSIVSVLILQYNLLKTATGQIILASVTISDVLVFIILVGIVHPISSTLTVILEIGIFIIGFVVADRLLNRKPNVIQTALFRLNCFFKREDFALVLMIIVALLISAIFQNIGLSFILGAFFAGLILHDGLIGKRAYDRISQTLSTMNTVFFIPIFFGFAGLEVALSSIHYFDYLGLAVLIIIALGVGVTLTYYTSRKVLGHKMDVVPKQLAGILGGRGAIGIVVATVAFSEGAIDEAGFSLVILATLIISIVVPFIAGRVTRPRKECEGGTPQPPTGA